MIPNKPCLTKNKLCRHTLCKQTNSSSIEIQIQIQGKVSHSNTNKHLARHKHNEKTLYRWYRVSQKKHGNSVTNSISSLL